MQTIRKRKIRKGNLREDITFIFMSDYPIFGGDKFTVSSRYYTITIA